MLAYTKNQIFISFSHKIDDQKIVRLNSLIEGFEQHNMIVSMINDEDINVWLICLNEESIRDSSHSFEILKCLEKQKKRKDKRNQILFLLMDENIECKFDTYLKPYDYIYFTELKHILTIINYIKHKSL